ncbi:MAG: phosphoribosylamine--glycine ligase [Acidimicrobiia bacterium]|nr:phosphoribosylamine--glycine ligase [Acidimicrobiia bacterium]MBT8194473.1 phosphoribosylamine--glycine ligase [Acidimicrobiia bacterium]NNF88597.1 phosphoribosylamine--glycine ligase [Acidimicrobiia bacterium]NNL14303.1 phosphoribosylamine--glycine ligase [Acidimicrobiia bacterium]NNL98963.1 phosphoribosylamine--glycine ligase [Acidimicrobiia bacterium]
METSSGDTKTSDIRAAYKLADLAVGRDRPGGRYPRPVNVLLLGGGGREHAIGWKLAQSAHLTRLISAPGNPGLAQLGSTAPIDPGDPAAVLELAFSESVDVVVIGPEAPLAAGVADALGDAAIPVFGPVAAAARLETSKTFAKDIMRRAGVPTGGSETFAAADPAHAHLTKASGPYVIKADGLAAGKGVLVTSDLDEAHAWVDDCFSGRFGTAGNLVVIEEFLDGDEISVFGLCDGTDVIGLRPARDYKRLADGDRGPNTGGMGSFTPVPGFGDDFVADTVEQMIKPVLDVLAEDGVPYVGFIYAGLMLTADGPKVLEFNCRLGDPETQALLPTMESDLLELITACVNGSVRGMTVDWTDTHAVNVVLAAKGYPEAPVKGDTISGLDHSDEDSVVFQAGTATEGSRTITAGGRVLSIVGLGSDLDAARDAAYAGAATLDFAGKQYRTDIAT